MKAMVKNIEPLICRFLAPDCDWKRVAFMAWCCEPMWRNYLLFHDDTGLGSPEVLREGLNMAWNVARADAIFPVARRIVSLSWHQRPGWINERKPYARSADEACFGIHRTLISMQSPKLTDALDVSDAAIYSIELNNRNQLPIDVERLAHRERLLRYEKVRQARCLTRLSVAGEEERRQTVSALRRAARRVRATVLPTPRGR